MEATGLSLGKSVLDGALGYAKSAVAEEVALQLGIQKDQAFIRDELEMMLAFLMAAHEERDEHKVIKTWVKQVRDVAYDAEDGLQDCAIRVGKPSWWRIPCMLLERRRAAKKMKELRAKVEDVSQRNIRYRLIKGSGSKVTTSAGDFNMARETMSSTEEARRQHEKAKVDLIQLINKKDVNLRVISVWETSAVPGETSIIKMAYDDLERRKKFQCYAWIRIMHPFNQTEFVQNIIQQFYVNSMEEATKTKQKLTPVAQDLSRMWMLNEDNLVDEFKKVLNEKSYLVVLTNLSSMEEWDQIKTCFPKNKNGSRLIVCTKQVKVASLCVGTGTHTALPEHKQLSVDQTLYAFYEKVITLFKALNSSSYHVTLKNIIYFTWKDA
jgi:hypothetical protein